MVMTATQFAEEYGMSVQAAQDTMNRYVANPGDPEFASVAGIMKAATGVAIDYTSGTGNATLVSAGAETNGEDLTTDLDTIFGSPGNGAMPAGQAGAETDGVIATPVALPAIIGAVAGFMTLGVFKKLLRTFGMKAIKGLIGVAAFKEFMDLIGWGADDGMQVRMRPGSGVKHKRYTIGHNPRVRTLAKVARHTQKLLKRHEKVIREFLPKKTTRYGIPPARALSAIERAAIKGQ